MVKTALIISYSPLERDPRVLRQIEALANSYRIITAGMTPSQSTNEASFIKIALQYDKHLEKPVIYRKIVSLFYVIPLRTVRKVRKLLFLCWFKKYEWYYWNSFRRSLLLQLSKYNYDLIVANDVDVLPIAVKLKKSQGSRLIFDAHEYSPLQYENDKNWLRYQGPFYTYLCKTYIKHADRCFTVSARIAEKYKELSGTPFEIFYNAPHYQELFPAKPTEGAVKFVHHGVASSMRGIDQLILAFKELPSCFQLHLILVPLPGSHLATLQDLAANCDNIFFHDPVPTTEISRYLNQFDVSLIFIPPINFNYEYCLPNKFFESIQGRLMILSGPSHEMEILVRKYNFGKVADGFHVEDIKSAALSITAQEIMECKENANQAAKELCFESNATLLEVKYMPVL